MGIVWVPNDHPESCGSICFVVQYTCWSSPYRARFTWFRARFVPDTNEADLYHGARAQAVPIFGNLAYVSGIWFTSDTHFGHNAMAATGKGWRPFATVEEHDEHLIERWNAVVRPDDHVWHLGDVGGPRSDDHALACVARCNGHKHLIAGNHDAPWPGHRHAHRRQRTWLEVFDSVQAFARRRVAKNLEVVLSHFPYEGDRGEPERYPQYRLRDKGLWLLHGHVHDAWAVDGRQINVGVDVCDWRPIGLHEVHTLIKEGS